MTIKRPEMLLWLADNRGIYIPRDFASSFADRAKSVSGVDAEQWAILEAGPDHEQYWDVWTEVSDYATVTDDHGFKYTVWQDGDCWLIPQGMEWSDEEQGFVWPGEDDDEEAETIMACVDCLDYVANGDLPDERPDLEADIQTHLGFASGRLACGDSDKDDEFSSEPCECCGSRLGGSRHQLVIMPEQT